VLVVHGGLECGILRAAKPSLDCISCGPLIESMHSPDERVSLRSVDQFFEVLKEALRTLPSA
jgi:dipeptidase D